MVCLLGGFIAASAQKDAKYEAELEKAVVLSADKALLVEMFENSFNVSMVQQGLLTKENCHAMSEELADEMYPLLINMTKELWRQEFSYDDLKKIQAWLSSPTGHKLLFLGTKTSGITQELLQDPEFMQIITKVVTKYVK